MMNDKTKTLTILVLMTLLFAGVVSAEAVERNTCYWNEQNPTALDGTPLMKDRTAKEWVLKLR